MQKSQKFWLVSRNPSTVSYHDPKQAFYNKADAKKHAEDLCKSTGHEFFVLEAVEVVKQSKPPIEWSEVVETVVNRAKTARRRDALGRFTYDW